MPDDPAAAATVVFPLELEDERSPPPDALRAPPDELGTPPVLDAETDPDEAPEEDDTVG
jgi:hypothetical protein